MPAALALTSAAPALSAPALDPPEGLTYTTASSAYMQNRAVQPNIPSSIGGLVARYCVSPALPVGLALNPSTGVISGTPTVTSAETVYTVAGTNSSGDARAVLSIAVTADLQQPSSLLYSSLGPSYMLNQPIQPNIPSSSGGPIANYSISPALPAGLSLDPSSGVITGTPTAISDWIPYTVTGANAAGSAQVNMVIAVVAPPPVSFTYSQTNMIFTQNQPIAPDVPRNGGGPISEYFVSPALPVGLALNPSTGVISGTPTVTSAETVYTVTGTNSSGDARAVLSIAVTADLQQPSGLLYSSLGPSYMLNQPIQSNVPSSSGGPIANYSISPALPAGLSLDPSSGVITGTPTAISDWISYTVTGANAAGSAHVIMVITVVAPPPANFTYSQTNVIYTRNQPIAPDVPRNGGGPISPRDAQLVLNIGGTSCLQPPTNLMCRQNAVTYDEGQAITPNASNTVGGQMTGYAVSPKLPIGLSLNPITGAISGTPTQASPQIAYQVIGYNLAWSTSVILHIGVK